jgi:hypothetical protein
VFRLDDVVLTIDPADLAERSGLQRVCASLGSSATPEPPHHQRTATLRLHQRGAGVPDDAAVCHDATDFRIFAGAGATYVSDGASTLRIRHDCVHADAYLDDSFYGKRRALQWNFWAFGILKLLRPLGRFALHGAGVVSASGQGMLIVGPSGSGKSTLALALIGAGWRYLSDEAVLLSRQGSVIAARPLRRSFYIDASDAAAYGGLRLGAETPDAAGGLRREVFIDERYANRRIDAMTPRMLLFPTIVDAARSAMTTMDSVSALRHLLAASGPQLFDNGPPSRD